MYVPGFEINELYKSIAIPVPKSALLVSLLLLLLLLLLSLSLILSLSLYILIISKNIFLFPVLSVYVTDSFCFPKSLS